MLPVEPYAGGTVVEEAGATEDEDETTSQSPYPGWHPAPQKSDPDPQNPYELQQFPSGALNKYIRK